MDRCAQLVFVLLVYLLSGCTVKINSTETGVVENNKINREEQLKIDSLQKQIYSAFVTKKPELITRLLSNAVNFEDLSAIDTMVNSVDVLADVKLFSFAGKYLVNNTSTSNINQVSGTLANEIFHFRFVPINYKTYILLFYIPDSYDRNDWLVSCVFAKEEKQWRLYGIKAGYISFGKKIAPYYYKESMQSFRQGRIINAAYTAMLASSLSKPAGDAFYYDERIAWGEYTKMVIDSFNRLISMPKVVEQVPSKPILIAMATDLHNGEICPVIGYKTNISLSDTAASEREATQLHKIIDKLVPGIEETGEWIEYRVISSTGSKQYRNLYRRFNLN